VVSAFVAGVDGGSLPRLRRLLLLPPPLRPYAFAGDGVALLGLVVGQQPLVAVDVDGVHVPISLLQQPFQRRPRHREARDVVGEVAASVAAAAVADAEGVDVLTTLLL
jgi:hypothetical protein